MIHPEFSCRRCRANCSLQQRNSFRDPATVLPTFVGAEPLDFKVPPIMEQAFGYRGNLRFVEFSYSPRTHQFGYSDGGDHVPSDAQLWTEFVNHPLVCAEIGEDDCPTLYGKFQRRGGRFCRVLVFASFLQQLNGFPKLLVLILTEKGSLCLQALSGNISRCPALVVSHCITRKPSS